MPKKATKEKRTAAKDKQALEEKPAAEAKEGEKKPHWGHGRKGPRAKVWAGSLSFGLVSVPVSLVTAARGHDFRFRQLHGPDLAPIEQRRYCSVEEVEVPWDEIARGYELSEDEGGGLVVLTDEELDAAAPERTETIEIEAFVDVAEIDPIQFDRPYHLALTGTSEGDRRAYRLLFEAMSASGRAAIGRMVMRTREYLVLVQPRGGILALTTLHFHDEVRSSEDIPAGEGVEAPESARRAAVAVIQELSSEWEPESYRDHFRDRVAALIKERRREHRRSGKKPQRSVGDMASAETESPDLMAALSKALDEAQGRRGDEAGEGAGTGGKGKPGKAKRSPGGAKPPGAKVSRGQGSLERLSRDELYQLAQEADLPGRSKMTKSELRRALADRQ